jgi:hypothetical protein
MAVIDVLGACCHGSGCVLHQLQGTLGHRGCLLLCVIFSCVILLKNHAVLVHSSCVQEVCMQPYKSDAFQLWATFCGFLGDVYCG